MAKTNTQPAAPAAKKVVITLEIGEPKKGVRALIISGAPAGEMPLIKAGTFAERHALLDQMWAELLRRPDQTPKVTEPKTDTKKTAPAKDEKPAESDDESEGADETSTEAIETNDDIEPVTEQPAAGGPPEIDSDQLVAPEAPADLPVIENDPTATIGALEAAILASKESHE